MPGGNTPKGCCRSKKRIWRGSKHTHMHTHVRYIGGAPSAFNVVRARVYVRRGRGGGRGMSHSRKALQRAEGGWYGAREAVLTQRCRHKVGQCRQGGRQAARQCVAANVQQGKTGKRGPTSWQGARKLVLVQLQDSVACTTTTTTRPSTCEGKTSARARAHAFKAKQSGAHQNTQRRMTNASGTRSKSNSKPHPLQTRCRGEGRRQGAEQLAATQA